jgi:hypothetical protein
MPIKYSTTKALTVAATMTTAKFMNSRSTRAIATVKTVSAIHNPQTLAQGATDESNLILAEFLHNPRFRHHLQPFLILRKRQYIEQQAIGLLQRLPGSVLKNTLGTPIARNYYFR